MSMLLTADIRGFTQNLDVAESRLNKFATTASKAGASLTRGLGLAFGYIATQSVKAASEFNRSNTILRQIVGESGIGQLTDEANRLGRESIFMATEVSAAQLELAKLGVRAGEINAVLDRTVKLTTVFGGALDETGEVVASTVRQFGLTLTGSQGFENVARVTDVMAAAFKNSALDLTKFREAMKNVGPAAAEVGLTLEDTVALLAVLANRSVDGSLGGTKLRSTLSDLAKQFPDVTESLEALSNGTLTYAELVELLNKRSALVGAIFQRSGDEIEDFKNVLNEANGILNEMATGIEDELFFNVEKLKNSFNSIARDIGDSLAPLVKSLAGAFDDLARSIQDMPEAKLGSITKGLLLLAATGPALFALGKSITILQKLSGAVTTLSISLVRGGANANAVRGLLGGPFLAVVAGAALASNEVGKFFKRIQDSNVYFKNIKSDIAELNQRISDFRTERELLEKQELKRPSTARADLEAYTRVESLAEAQSDLAFWLDLRIQNEGELKRVQELGLKASEKKQLKEIARIQTYIVALQKLIALYTEEETERIKLLNADVIETPEPKDLDRFAQGLIGVNSELADMAAKARQGVLGLPALGLEGIVTFNSEQTEAQAISAARATESITEYADSTYRAALANRTLAGSGKPVEKTLKAISDAAELAGQNKLLLQATELTSFLREQLDFIGQAFLDAANGAKSFGEALVDSLEATFRQLVAKLITLIALYGVLAVLSGGSGQIANIAANAMGNDMGEFMLAGFGFTKMRTAGMAMGSDGETGGVKVMGAVSGNNLVLLNQTGPRAFDRTFG